MQGKGVEVSQSDWPKFMTRIPKDAKRWIAAEARKNGSSQNSEIVRSIRERMDRVKSATGEVVQARAPAAAHQNSVRQDAEPVT
jgi:hypothetical protein